MPQDGTGPNEGRTFGNGLLGQLPTTIFTTMSALAVETGSVNLGQGFPDDEGPEFLRQAAAEYILSGPSQYPPMWGMPALREAVAAHDLRFYGLSFDPKRDVLVTSGATEALAAALFGLLNPGDEAIVIEPAYDSYAPIIRLAGAQPKFVRLDPPGWRLDKARLEAACTARTKVIVLNSPMNPIGKVFDPAELAMIADVALAHDLRVICDEVYEHIVFSGNKHTPLMCLPGMADRCVRIASAGKTFSLTGWKVGYASGATALIELMAKAHQFLTFTTPPALQLAVARGLGQENAAYHALAHDLEAKRDRLATGLHQAAFSVLPAQGTYFLIVDLADRGVRDDLAFATKLARQAGVVAIPLSAFYDSDPPQHLLRFCFSKQFAVLDKALERLSGVFAAA
jgi:aspartate/methionine/tyrosine aminotransferase